MAPIKDSFLDLERHRQLLEDNVEKLRNALQQWQLWEAEYEALKEEVETLPAPPSRAELARVRRDFDGQLVTKKEVTEIFGGTELKSAEQVISVVSRRLDYVSKNVQTLERQLETAENKLAAATVISNPDIRDEEGQPVTDIIEELDEDDNIVSYRLQTPGSVQPQIREALEKAGIKDLPDGKEKPEMGEAPSTSQSVEDELPVSQHSSSSKDAPTTTYEAEPDSDEEETASRRKSVSFAEDTKPGHDDTDGVDAQRSRTAQRLVGIMQQAKDQERLSETPVMPDDESTADAELRREMLRYGMSDIAPIVAELELEEDSSNEDEDWDDDDLDEDDEDTEDQYGRYKYSMIDDDYRERMKELEQRLGFKSSRTIADEEAEENGVPDEGIGRVTIVPVPSSNTASNEPATSALSKGGSTAKPSKSVKFANALDIAAEEEKAPTAPAAPLKESEPRIDPLSDIVERTVTPNASTEARPKKASRFKAARTGGTVTNDVTGGETSSNVPSRPRGPTDAPSRFLEQDVRTAPTGPDGQTLADTVVERDGPAGVQEPDELDATLLHQEAASEYHRMRNRMIQKDGGFLKENQSPIVPLDEEEGGTKRMSRFKAARLSRQ